MQVCDKIRRVGREDYFFACPAFVIVRIESASMYEFRWPEVQPIPDKNR